MTMRTRWQMECIDNTNSDWPHWMVVIFDLKKNKILVRRTSRNHPTYHDIEMAVLEAMVTQEKPDSILTSLTMNLSDLCQTYRITIEHDLATPNWCEKAMRDEQRHAHTGYGDGDGDDMKKEQHDAHTTRRDL